jgi:hypothetical protein
VATPAGKLVETSQEVLRQKVNIFSVQTSTGKRYAVTYGALKPADKATGAETILSQIPGGLMASVPGARITKEAKLTVEGAPARDWAISSAGAILYARGIVTDDRVYSLATGDVPEADARAFLDSFRLTGG